MAKDDTTHYVNTSYSTEHAAAVIIIGALGMLILIRRGFRGIGVPGVGAVNIGG